MKRIKFILSVAILSLSIMVYKNYSMTEHERLVKANIEALSNDGEADGSRITCSNTIANEGSGSITRTKCSTCLDVKCTDYSDSSKCSK